MLGHPKASLLPLEALVWAVQCPRDSWFPAGLGIGWAEMGDVTPMSGKLRCAPCPVPIPAQPCPLPSPLDRRR